MYLKEGYNISMISEHQTPTKSGFHSKTNADEITNGIDLNEKIAIVGPTTLIAILQIISRIWSSKRQSEATNLIISAATEIYDKTRLVGDAFEDFEKSLEQANKSIASGKTRTKNLVSKVEKMRTIGGLEPTKDISDKLRVIDKE